jgi:hypothetical protein
MKTPREILFERHRSAEPKLDDLRNQVLAALSERRKAEAFPGSRPQSPIGAALKSLWSELIWPSRRAWAGLGAIWAVVLALNLEMKAESPALPAVRSARAGQVVQAFAEQRRVLAELLPPANSQIQAPSESRAPASSNSSGTNPRSDLRNATPGTRGSEYSQKREVLMFASLDFGFVPDFKVRISSFNTRQNDPC